MTDDALITFRCPECGERIAVNVPMRRRLIDHGCVLCRGRVSRDDFDDAGT